MQKKNILVKTNLFKLAFYYDSCKGIEDECFKHIKNIFFKTNISKNVILTIFHF